MSLTGNDLIKIGFTEGKALGIALELAQTNLQASKRKNF